MPVCFVWYCSIFVLQIHPSLDALPHPSLWRRTRCRAPALHTAAITPTQHPRPFSFNCTWEHRNFATDTSLVRRVISLPHQLWVSMEEPVVAFRIRVIEITFLPVAWLKSTVPPTIFHIIMMAGGRYIHPDVRQMVWDAMENSFPDIFNEHAQRYNPPPFEPPSYVPHDATATHPSQRQPPSTGPFRPPFRLPAAPHHLLQSTPCKTRQPLQAPLSRAIRIRRWAH